VVQKSAAFDLEMQAVPFLLQIATEYPTDCAFRQGSRFRETGEIVLAYEQTRRLRHSGDVDPARMVKILAGEMRRHHRAEVDLISICLRNRVAASVKTGRDPVRGKDANIAGKHAIEGAQKLGRRNP
jgi:hypothetical protein